MQSWECNDKPDPNILKFCSKVTKLKEFKFIGLFIGGPDIHTF